MTLKNYITIATYGTGLEAQLASTQLEASGISTCVLNSEIVDTAWFLGGAIGGAQLQVREDDADVARELIEQMRSAGTDLDDVAEEDDIADEISAPESATDALVNRALRAAAIGLLFLPLQFYSLYLIGKVLVSRAALDRSQRKKLALAAVLDCCVLTLAVIFFWPQEDIPMAPLPNGGVPRPLEI
ncbi:hypothetical protein [Aeoliella sp.]|uniref:hypothetical protein n=1 Tax=Aeoliella sp. TaxID=2795800 RepID=UPI003CCBE798